VALYTDRDDVYVKVIDTSHIGETLLANVVEIRGITYDLFSVAGDGGVFKTEGLKLQLVAEESLTATYTDPTDSTDTSADTIPIIASELVVDSFYVGPNPFQDEVVFGFNGTGIATTMSVAVFNLAGDLVWKGSQTDVTKIPWDGEGLASGCYIYVITATNGTTTFEGDGLVFIKR
jgi:hypothetical protein